MTAEEAKEIIGRLTQHKCNVIRVIKRQKIVHTHRCWVAEDGTRIYGTTVADLRRDGILTNEAKLTKVGAIVALLLEVEKEQ